MTLDLESRLRRYGATLDAAADGTTPEQLAPPQIEARAWRHRPLAMGAAAVVVLLATVAGVALVFATRDQTPDVVAGQDLPEVRLGVAADDPNWEWRWMQWPEHPQFGASFVAHLAGEPTIGYGHRYTTPAQEGRMNLDLRIGTMVLRPGEDPASLSFPDGDAEDEVVTVRGRPGRLGERVYGIELSWFERDDVLVTIVLQRVGTSTAGGPVWSGEPLVPFTPASLLAIAESLVQLPAEEWLAMMAAEEERSWSSEPIEVPGPPTTDVP